MNKDLLERVMASPRLPSLPTIALEVIDLVQQHDVNIKQIAQTIQMDPALSGKILKTVNSSFYGQSQTISTISHALVVLGLNSVKTLALGFSLITNLKLPESEGFDHFLFWKRSLYTASAAKLLANRVGVVQHEESFLGGLLHDLGVLAMAQALDGEYEEAIASVQQSPERMVVVEAERFDLDHTQVGAALAESWNLPPILRAPIQHHHKPDEAPDEVAPVVRCVALGSAVAEVFISDAPGESLERFYKLAEQWFSLSREAAEPMLAEVHKSTVEMRRLFDLPTGELGNADDILARANEAMLQLSLQNQQQTNELKLRNEQLAKKATTDSLTGAANRGHFNDVIQERFEATRNGEGPWTIVFFDADHFKKFNDTYGHQVGDRVLIALAKTLKEEMPKDALVARYGGEEFAVILPGTGRQEGARIAEQTRRLIHEVEVTSDEGETLRITASIGAATDDGSFFNAAEQVVKAADKGVYAAKKAGRNCVRVFAPRPKRKAS